MRKLLKLLSITLSFIAVLAACKKDYYSRRAQVNTELSEKAGVQLYNSIIGSNRSYLYVDFKPVNGATIAYGTSFPSGAAAFSVNNGLRNFLFRDTLVTSLQTAISINETLAPSSNYTIFAYDTVNAAKSKLVTTNIVVPADTSARIRFVNLIYSKTAIPNLDIYSAKKKAVIYSNIAPETVTDFMPYASFLTDTLIVRTTGSTTNNLINRTTAGRIPLQLIINPTPKRSYTMVLRGSYYTDTSTQTNLRTLTSFTNN
ncbi:MAG: DUF4397 domain-containing protein [Bacteroidetes bacterium]|nr:MAG: DUF4397 domain-containing protein [Bacteroidota bacterium]